MKQFKSPIPKNKKKCEKEIKWLRNGEKGVVALPKWPEVTQSDLTMQ